MKLRTPKMPFGKTTNYLGSSIDKGILENGHERVRSKDANANPVSGFEKDYAYRVKRMELGLKPYSSAEAPGEAEDDVDADDSAAKKKK